MMLFQQFCKDLVFHICAYVTHLITYNNYKKTFEIINSYTWQKIKLIMCYHVYYGTIYKYGVIFLCYVRAQWLFISSLS